MKMIDLDFVLDRLGYSENEKINILSDMLVQKDSASVLVNVETCSAILFRRAEMEATGREMYIENFDVFTKKYYEDEYYGDDLEAVLKATRVQNIVSALKEDPNYEFSYSVFENNQIHRKNMSFQFVLGSEKLLCVFNHDITEAVKEEERRAKVVEDALELAKRASKTKSDFLIKLSTDLRSPIYSISMLADKALASDDLDEIRHCLMEIKRKSTKFSAQVNNVMNLSLIDKGELEVNLKPLVLKSALGEIADALEPVAKQRNISLIIEVDKPKLPVIMMDPVIIKDTFLGLLINSILYGNPGGYAKLKITSEYVDKNHVRALCVISDNGRGMTKEHVQKLGQEFFVIGQKDALAKNSELGLGLGIPLAKAFVDRLGGTMKIESELGVGTTVTIDVLIEKANVEDEYYFNEMERMKKNASKEDFSRFRALIADDNEINRDVAKVLLQKIGLSVETANNCQEVIGKLEASPDNFYDVLFLDVNMFNLDGRTATMTIRELERQDLSDITIIGTTAYALRDERIRTLESGMDYHMPIPLDENVIMDILLRELFNLNPQKESAMRGFRIIK